MRRIVEKVTGSKVKAAKLLNQRAELTQRGCYKAAVQHFKLHCFNWHRTQVSAQATPPTPP